MGGKEGFKEVVEGGGGLDFAVNLLGVGFGEGGEVGGGVELGEEELGGAEGVGKVVALEKIEWDGLDELQTRNERESTE